MNDREKKKAELRKKSKVSRRRTDDLLEEEIKILKEATHTDLESLRPKITDEEEYNKLVAEVEESTRRNESLAELKSRFKKVGLNTIRIAKEAAKQLKGL